MRRAHQLEKTRRKENLEESQRRMPEIIERSARIKRRDPQGVHVTVWVGAVRIDWWPSTGRYLRSDRNKASSAGFDAFRDMLDTIPSEMPDEDVEVLE